MKCYGMKCDLNFDKGEDSEPIYLDNLIAVFDGLGGSGGTKYTLKDGKQRTGAYLASREVRDLVECFFNTIEEKKETKEEDTKKILTGNIALEKLIPISCLMKTKNPEIVKLDISEEEIEKETCDETSEKLKSFIVDGLLEYASNNNIEENKFIKSKMVKLLPTTMACLRVVEDKAELYWAGDSRIYFFNKDGLHILTEDDLEVKQDSFENMIEDSPMNNVISISSSVDFHINAKEINLEKGFYIAMTDGLFGYLKSPIQLEEMLYDSISDAENVQDIVKNFMKFQNANRQDDQSISILVSGDFKELKKDILKNKSDLKLITENYDMMLIDNHSNYLYNLINNFSKSSNKSNHVIYQNSSKYVYTLLQLELFDYINKAMKDLGNINFKKYNYKLQINKSQSSDFASLYKKVLKLKKDLDKPKFKGDYEFLLSVKDDLKSITDSINFARTAIFWYESFKPRYESKL